MKNEKKDYSDVPWNPETKEVNLKSFLEYMIWFGILTGQLKKGKNGKWMKTN